MSDHETRHTISESADKIQLETKIKRGSATRDQDEIKVKVKGDDPQAAANTLHDTVKAIDKNETASLVRRTRALEGADD